MNNIYTIIASIVLFTAGAFPGISQNVDSEKNTEEKKAWEIGFGGVLNNWNRISATSLIKTETGYDYSVDINHAIVGPQIYIAREMNPWLYLDLQTSLGIEKPRHQNNWNLMSMTGIGAQFRLTPLLKSKYIEPFARIGVNLLYKNFGAVSAGSFDTSNVEDGSWSSSDTWNKNGNTKSKDFAFPITAGLGLNAWMSDNWGVGIQGDYVFQTQKDLSNFVQVSVRVMRSFGGKTRAPKPEIQYVETIVEKPVVVEKPVEVEKIVWKEQPSSEKIVYVYDLLRNIDFDFDDFRLREGANTQLDRAAKVLKEYPNLHYLIVGYTDARGTDAYNMTLSYNRAKTIMDELIKRGVPATSLKCRGVGKRTAAMSPDAKNELRLGDRKVTIEIVDNLDYWKALK